MQAKMFEIRDRATFIPVMAVQLQPVTEADRYLLARAGYGLRAATQAEYVIMTRVSGGEVKSSYAPHDWAAGGARTLTIAHEYIMRHWSELESGAVIDVEFIMGVSQAPKVSESVTEPL